MPLSRKIAIGAASLMIVGFAGFRVSGGPAGRCKLRLGNARAACYQRFFTSRLVNDGVAGAVAILDTLSRDDRDVSRRAHEYAHGIGIAAYTRYPDIVSTFTAC